MLSIGMAVYRDFDGVYFSVQALRIYHKNVLKKSKLIIVDNAPSSKEGKRIKNFIESLGEPDKTLYVPLEEPVGTSPARNKIFEVASTEWVLVMDSHVLIVPWALTRLLEYIQAHPNSRDLLSGPLLYDNLVSYETHLIPKWRGGMYGIWGRVPSEIVEKGEPFEIPAMGLGLFVMRKAAWPGFHPLARGFGGEEVYIHEKVRRNGGVCLCLPFLKWVHRFNEASDIRYPLRMWDRIRNYVLEFQELGWDVNEVKEYFVTQGFITEDDWAYLIENPEEHIDPPADKKFLDKPVTAKKPNIFEEALKQIQSQEQPEKLQDQNIETTQKGCCPERELFEKRRKEREKILKDLLDYDWSRLVQSFRDKSYLWSFESDFRELLKDARLIVDITAEPLESTLFLAETMTKGDLLVLSSDLILFPEFDAVSRKLAEHLKRLGTPGEKRILFRTDPEIYRYDFVRAPDVIFFNEYPSVEENHPLWSYIFRFLHEGMKKMEGYIVLTKTNYYLKPGNPVYTLVADLLKTTEGLWGVVREEKSSSGYWVLSNKKGLKHYETTLVEQLQSYSKSLVKRLTGKNVRVSDEEAERRWQTCLLCPHRDGVRCTVCGCYLKQGIMGDGKIYWSDERCPKGYW